MRTIKVDWKTTPTENQESEKSLSSETKIKKKKGEKRKREGEREKMAAGEALRKGWVDEVQRWAAMKRTGVTLRYMMEFGSRCKQKNLLISAQFLHKQLPIRLARRVMELESLPFGLSQKHPVLKVSFLFFPPFFFLFFLIYFVYYCILFELEPREGEG